MKGKVGKNKVYIVNIVETYHNEGEITNVYAITHENAFSSRKDALKCMHSLAVDKLEDLRYEYGPQDDDYIEFDKSRRSYRCVKHWSDTYEFYVKTVYVD